MARNSAQPQASLFGKPERRPRGFKLKPWAPKLSENDVERQVLDFLRIRGWRVDRQHAGKARFPDGTWFNLHAEGTADWFAHRPRMSPSCLYVEVKAPGERPDPAQELYLECARREGYLATWTDSIDRFCGWYAVYFPGEFAR